MSRYPHDIVEDDREVILTNPILDISDSAFFCQFRTLCTQPLIDELRESWTGSASTVIKLLKEMTMKPTKDEQSQNAVDPALAFAYLQDRRLKIEETIGSIVGSGLKGQILLKSLQTAIIYSEIWHNKYVKHSPDTNNTDPDLLRAVMWDAGSATVRTMSQYYPDAYHTSRGSWWKIDQDPRLQGGMEHALQTMAEEGIAEEEMDEDTKIAKQREADAKFADELDRYEQTVRANHGQGF